MDLWNKWMRKPVINLGFKKRDSTCGHAVTNHMASEDDGQAAYDAADVRLAEKTNACVESLKPAERLAVYVKYGFASLDSWKRAYPALEFAVTKEEALKNLRQLVQRRCM